MPYFSPADLTEGGDHSKQSNLKTAVNIEKEKGVRATPSGQKISLLKYQPDSTNLIPYKLLCSTGFNIEKERWQPLTLRKRRSQSQPIWAKISLVHIPTKTAFSIEKERGSEPPHLGKNLAFWRYQAEETKALQLHLAPVIQLDEAFRVLVPLSRHQKGGSRWAKP